MIKPILFNTEMVRAILDNRKTSTRRKVDIDISNGFDVENDGKTVCAFIDQATGDTFPPIAPCPYRVGDILWVRETWHKYTKRVGKGEGCHLEERYGYKASIANSEDAETPWKPSIHMPKEAARIFLRITDVRVERLQDITEEQAQKEGCDSGLLTGPCTARGQFENLWKSTIKKSVFNTYGWSANPWVWVLEFERCEKPEPCIWNGMEPAEDKRPCIGFGDEWADEPCEMCKSCEHCTGNDSDE